MPGSQSAFVNVIARAGYGSRGVVYVLVGGLAVLAAATGGGKTTGTKGALATLLGEPFGQALLAVLAAGLLAYAGWRLIQAATDADHHGTGAKGIAIRLGQVVSAISYTALAFFAVSLIMGWGTGGGGGQSTQDWTAKLLAQPFGRWLVGAVGLIVIGVGLAHGNKVRRETFRRYLQIDQQTYAKVAPICKFGLLARGLVFVIIGGFFIVAAVKFSSGQARGLHGALETLQSQPYGPYLLGVVALGLVAYGIFSFIEMAYRRID